MIGQAIDGLIGMVSPVAQLRRALARQQIARIQNATGHSGIDQLMGGSGGNGYDAAQSNRLTRSRQAGALSENRIPRSQIQALRNDSWNLYRNNPQARKIIRQLEAKVVGRGLMPLPLSLKSDGTAYKEFRQRAREIWKRVAKQLDYRGRPGRGGQSLADIQKTALRGTVLGGEVFIRTRRLTQRRQKQLDLLLPIQVQLIHADRLDDTRNDDATYYGIQFNKDSERVAYHFRTTHPADNRGVDTKTTRAWASEVLHLYMAEDIDQIRGTPWFSAALLKMRDVGDYEYNELQAAAMAACVVLGYRRSPGQNQLGVDAPGDWDLTDSDGNPITSMSPGMIIDLGQSGELDGFNPQRPNVNAEGFIQHMIRSEAVSVPGVKSSSLTSDYRRSSFSSERSADNDAWPELEGLQDWMSDSFCTPLYESIMDAAVQDGLFDGVSGFSETDYIRRREQYLIVDWKGPVARSIKPSEDALAAMKRMRNFTSSPQLESALVGRSLVDILDDWEEFLSQASERNIPQEAILSLLGVQVTELDVDSSGDESDVPGKETDLNDHFEYRGMLNGHPSEED